MELPIEGFEKQHEPLHKVHDFSYKVHEQPQPSMEFNSSNISGLITYDRDQDIFIIKGSLHSSKYSTSVEYWASNPVLRNYSYSGSGLPFPNPDIAYENTSNKGTIELIKSSFEIKVKHPNSYYVNQGKTLIKPHVHLKFNNDDRIYTLIISDNLPYRSLTNLPNQPRRTIGR